MKNMSKAYAQNAADKAEQNANNYTDNRFSQLSNQSNQRFEQLNSKIERAEKRLNAGIAGVTAISSIPYVAENSFCDMVLVLVIIRMEMRLQQAFNIKRH